MHSHHPDAQALLDFWFGAEGSTAHGQMRAEWFRKEPDFDAIIARRFGARVDAALAGGLGGLGGLAEWTADTAGALARIVLLDQFPRNIYRATARAFAGDPLALAAARALVASGQDHALPPVARMFAYLPFEHCEDLQAQDQSVQLFTALAAESASMANVLDYAHRHRAVIERFGRFPHRNEALGRMSTAAEVAFLKEPGSSF